jgi:hypothetical protein
MAWGFGLIALLTFCPLPAYNVFASKAGKNDFRLSSAAPHQFIYYHLFIEMYHYLFFNN